VVLPHENKAYSTDTIAGTDLFCLLYSKKLLPIDTICQQIEQEKGTFSERLYKIMGDKLVLPKDMKCTQKELRFEALLNDKTVMPIIVEIPIR
jgi:hypothetical protein